MAPYRIPTTPNAMATGAKLAAASGNSGTHETEQPVGAGLQQQAGEDDAARRGRLGVRVGQPGVQRHDRQLHGERDEEAEHEPHRRRRAHRRAQQLRDSRTCRCRSRGGARNTSATMATSINSPLICVKRKNFDGGVDAALVPPDPDEEIHRDEHQFPEEVEQEQIERQEDADDAGRAPTTD